MKKINTNSFFCGYISFGLNSSMIIKISPKGCEFLGFYSYLCRDIQIFACL